MKPRSKFYVTKSILTDKILRLLLFNYFILNKTSKNLFQNLFNVK